MALFVSPKLENDVRQAMELAHGGSQVLFLITTRTSLDKIVGAMMAAHMKRPIGMELPTRAGLSEPGYDYTLDEMSILHGKWRSEVESNGGELKCLQVEDPTSDFGVPDLGDFVPDHTFWDEYWPHENT